MKLKRYQEFTNEGFKDLIYGAVLFLASCTNCHVTDDKGNHVITPVEQTIIGRVEKEHWIPDDGHYYQNITIKGNDGNTYEYDITNNMLTSSSWEINDGDSVRMVFDENGDSHVYKK
jgi:cytochrome c2